MNPELTSDRAGAASSELAQRPLPSGATPPAAIAGETANGSVPRLGHPYPHDYAPLVDGPRPPLGTFAASGGRPEHARPDGGTGLGQQAPPGWPEYSPGR